MIYPTSDIEKSFLYNDRLRLRALEPEDINVLYSWENKSEWWKYGSTRAPYSRYLLKQYILESHKDIYETKQLRLIIELNENKERIGIVDLFDFDPYNKKAEIGILIDPNYHKNGFGATAIELLKEYCFSFLKMHQLYTFVAADNDRSRSLFIKCGFNAAATLKDWISFEDSFSDVIVMQHFNPTSSITK